MSKHQSIEIVEPLLQQEIILGMCIGVGILMLVVSETVGMIIVLVSLLAMLGIYLYRIVVSLKEREEGLVCGFTWFNNGIMVLAVAGILVLMLTDVYHKPVLYAAASVSFAGLLLNGVFLRYNIRGFAHISAQARLLIALVVMVVFFLL